MKYFLILITIFCSVSSYSQTAKVDTSKSKIYKLFETFYDEVLQSEKGELSEQTISELQGAYADSLSYEVRLLDLFIQYQEYISSTSGSGIQPDPNEQIRQITQLENRMNHVYDKLPAIIYVYKVESFASAQKMEVVQKTILEGLKNYPDSVPLKVYLFMFTEDELVKKDLLTNHRNHWLVKQFEIK